MHDVFIIKPHINLKLFFYVHLTACESFMFIIVLLLIKYIKTICKSYFLCMIMTIYNYIAVPALLKQRLYPSEEK